ncbi:SusD/RagB family nutrient-binding outer membrane lipoprotein [Pedobacter yulinensis]|uniref:SusD/RagB family nutrient-binding outer membrane lipoprotein n=1 Tax=Pedobacter yulinensis TaxID=2126353 RepID=A0A2T3HPS8_9SPHI|nr:SusD/RagB family nutrient-binding outer membrane lipoprotein [Pedobacter yulinensis]PST84407.1 SusD/RagB family nutrient-binding outer membrane lipoprotein [Pedobacter yulinensis]
MKTIYRFLAVALSTSLFLSACTKDFAKLNTDPVSYGPGNFDPNYLLTTSQLTYTGSFDFSYETWRSNLIYCSTMVQGLSTVIGYWAGDKYLLNADYTASYWAVAYPEQVKPVVDLVKLTEGKEQYANLHQIARIMRALILQRISDIYGDVPYSEAGLGYYGKTYFPKYDKQEAIYKDILNEYEDAANKLDPAKDKPSGDAYLGGDIAKWKRFGYTLMLRAAMRLSKADENTAKAYVAKAIGKTMTSNADNALLAHDASGGRPTVNRNAQVLLGSPEADNVKWSRTFIDLLKNTNDPRLSVIARVGSNTAAAAQKGMPNGYDLSGVAGRDISSAPGYTTIADYSRPAEAMLRLNTPTFILTYGESELLLADAAQRWGIAGSAAAHYKAGVVAAITYLSQYGLTAVSETAAAAYVDANIPYNPATGLNQINTQYWMLTNTMFDFYESWSNWRRSGFPALTPVNYVGNVTQGTIPRRFPYPQSEANTNPDNYNPARNSVPGGDNLTGRVWWDK